MRIVGFIYRTVRYYQYRKNEYRKERKKPTECLIHRILCEKNLRASEWISHQFFIIRNFWEAKNVLSFSVLNSSISDCDHRKIVEIISIGFEAGPSWTRIAYFNHGQLVGAAKIHNKNGHKNSSLILFRASLVFVCVSVLFRFSDMMRIFIDSTNGI